MAKVWKRSDRDVWVLDFLDATGRRVRKVASGAKTKREAEAQLRHEQNDVDQDQTGASPLRDIRLSDYADVWLSRMQGELTQKTWRGYRQILSCHILPILGAYQVRSLTVSAIGECFAQKRQTVHRYGTGYSKDSLRLMKAALSSLLTDAVEVDGLLKSNPALALNNRKKRNRSRQGKAEVRAMDRMQRDRFLDALVRLERAGRVPYPLWVLLMLRVLTGLRPEEGYGLQTGDIDFETKRLRVERAVSLSMIKSTKTEESREVDLCESLLPVLRDYLTYVRAEALAHGRAEPYLLFPGRDGGPITEADERMDRTLFQRVLSEAGLSRFSPVDLRHTFASLLLSANVPLLYVSRQLGHAKPTTTLQYYAKWLPEERTERFVNHIEPVIAEFGTKVGTKGTQVTDPCHEPIENIGGPCRDRTYGPLIKSQLLCQLS